MSFNPIPNPLPARIDSSPTLEELLLLILAEMRVHNTILQIGLSVNDDIALLRDDARQQLN